MQTTLFILSAVFMYSAFAIPDEYIVTFKEGVDLKPALDFLQRNERAPNGERVGHIKHRFSKDVLNAFAGVIKPSLLDQFKKRFADDILDIEEDQVVEAYGSVQVDPSVWGLPRISYKPLVSNSLTYVYPDCAGEGITAYVLDTGIDISHPEFGTRAASGWNTLLGTTDTNDVYGHGTHCAGIIGSSSYGVAKNINLVAVKVLGDDGSGTFSSVIAGIDWVVNTATAGGYSVISMSLGGPLSTSLNNAVDNAYASGFPVIVAAGNDRRDACDYSPASANGALTVGATDINNYRASFSNKGRCVDVSAPGTNIKSTLPNGGNGLMSGTSMATPFVSGTIALYKCKYPSLDVAALYQIVNANANPSKTKGVTIVYNNA